MPCIRFHVVGHPCLPTLARMTTENTTTPVAIPTPERRGPSPIDLLGWFASVMAVCMYVSYIAQIQLNLAGQKGSLIQPLTTVLNCALWSAYGIFKPGRDWPVVLANLPGVALGAVTFTTALP